MFPPHPLTPSPTGGEGEQMFTVLLLLPSPKLGRGAGGEGYSVTYRWWCNGKASLCDRVRPKRHIS
ncbi:hypothetical protein MC7420_94 [Coleofasciculus chthonoplastes PCC 7420]|uniref:Uncharacterized protein n=1 Tax=Coleofasciculus chthonoplastes PCC 7420 TaxID=118168 RepID=B4W2S7_9CYAN|nr:hypothetical protein MC7420_94 [Coleofasciculus chthonoplastes PCC 7420]